MPEQDELDELLADPRGRGLLGDVLAAASAGHADDASHGEQAALTAFRTTFAANPARRRFAALSGRAAATVLIGGVVVSGSAAAAATGTLPDHAQRAARSLLRGVGIHVPAPHGRDDGGSRAVPAGSLRARRCFRNPPRVRRRARRAVLRSPGRRVRPWASTAERWPQPGRTAHRATRRVAHPRALPPHTPCAPDHSGQAHPLTPRHPGQAHPGEAHPPRAPHLDGPPRPAPVAGPTRVHRRPCPAIAGHPAHGRPVTSSRRSC